MINSSNSIKADLHNHFETPSRFNHEFNHYINIASSRLGPNGIVGLVNFEDNRFEEFSQLKGYEREFINPEKSILYIPEKRLYVVRGQEIPTKDGHLLVLATPFNSKIYSGMFLENTLSSARENHGIIIAPHPFFISNIGNILRKTPELIEYFDGIETHNSKAALSFPFLLPINSNRKALDFYIMNIKGMDIGAISVSDSHSPEEIAISYSLLKCESAQLSTNSLRQMIRNKHTINGDKRTNSRLSSLKHITTLFEIKLGIR
ncbi:MAG: hypothetical protein N3D20_02870 [Candidatus Pacearchaeota archaeon]|nr:hypothetical protein [Candidatus Pacearchaeota archaeon]